MKRRGLAHSVGQVAEKLVIDFFNDTPVVRTSARRLPERRMSMHFRGAATDIR
jgi:hypothetical protein